jgi:hypothetical protein
MSVKVGDKIRILENNPQGASLVKKGDIVTVKSLYYERFHYCVEGKVTNKWTWAADYDQKGKTWSKIKTKDKDPELSGRDESFWNDQYKQFKDKTFKVGERVVVYDSRLEGLRQVATVSAVKDPNGFNKKALLVHGVKRVDNDCYDELIIHPRQVRKLKVKT